MPGLRVESPRSEAELETRFRVSSGEYVTALEVSRDGKLCIAGLGDGRVLAIDLASGNIAFTLDAHGGGVLNVCVSPDGKFLVTCGQDEAAKLWTTRGEFVRALPGGGGAWVEHVAWSPANDRLATAAGKKIRIWNAEGDPVVETEPLASTVTGLAWRADGTGLAASCYGGVHILPLKADAKVRHLPWKGSLISMAWSPDAKVVACGSQDCSVHFWRLSSGQDSEIRGYPFKPKALAWDRESKLLACGGNAAITVWDFRGKGPEGTKPSILDAHQGVCTQLVFSPRKTILASGSEDSSVLLWSPRKEKTPLRYAFMDAEVTGLAWHPDHDTLIGADATGTVCAWATQ